MAGLPSANLVPRSTRWLQGSYVSVHPVSCTNLGHPASSCSLPPSTGSPLLKQPPTLAAPRSYFPLPTRSTVINQPLHRSAGPGGCLQPPLSSARPHRHAATAPNSTPTAQTGRQTALEWLSAASRHATHIRGRDNTSWPPLSTTNGLSRRPCPLGGTIPRAVTLPGPRGGPLGPPERLAAAPSQFPFYSNWPSLCLWTIWRRNVRNREATFLAPKIETARLCLGGLGWWLVSTTQPVGSFRPIPHPACQS